MRTLFASIAALFSLAAASAAESIGPLELRPQASVGTQGILVADLVSNRGELNLPRVVLAPAPAIGRPVFLTRAQISDLLGKKAPDLVCSNWLGADRVKVVRATRVLNQAAVCELLAATLQADQIKDRGDLELHFNRPWNNVVLPDDPLSVKILEMPGSGVSVNFLCRFELFAGGESAGVYQAGLLAKVWKEVYVARSNIGRGELLKESDVILEKRDVLANREYLTNLPLDDAFVEFRENLPAGSLVTARYLRLRTVLKRGRQVDAMFQDPTMTISVRAEALEDGIPGQIVRLRNLQSRREFKGKVQDEQTVQVLF